MKWGDGLLNTRFVVAAILGVVIVVVFSLWQGNRDKAKATKATADQLLRTDSAATAIGADYDTTYEGIKHTESIVQTARQSYSQGATIAKRKNPAIRDWADQPIPVELRELAAERRRARERLGNPDDGGGRDTATPAR